MRKFLISVLVFGIVAFSEAAKRYENFKVIQVTPKNQRQLGIVQNLAKNGFLQSINFWREPSTVDRPIDMMVDPNDAARLLRVLGFRGIEAKILIENVQQLIDEQHHLAKQPFEAGDAPNNFSFTDYHSLQEIYDWFDSLVKAYPNLASIVSIGQSFEKRDMKLLKLGAAGTKKPAYFIDAGIHAREWISVSTATYIVNELVTNYTTNPDYKEFLDKIDFYILASFNPDGYEYTRNDDRMWRKSRSGPIKGCYGADLNRNFDFHWMESGASDVPCSETFAGSKAFSEIEAVNVANFLQKDLNFQAYITLHSYSDLWMYPFGYKEHCYPPDVDELKAVSINATNALKAVHGTTFEYGTKTDVLYADSGTSDDWARGVANIKWVYALELRPGDGDVQHDQFYGFQLPPSYIIPVGEETWAGMQVVAKKIITG